MDNTLYEGFSSKEIVEAALRLNTAHGISRQEWEKTFYLSTSMVFHMLAGRHPLPAKIVDRLPAFYGCNSLVAMMDKANTMHEEIDYVAFGRALKHARNYYGIGLHDLAEATRMPFSSLSRLENGHSSKWHDYFPARIYQFFGCHNGQEFMDMAATLPRPIPEAKPHAPKIRQQFIDQGFTPEYVGLAFKCMRLHKGLLVKECAEKLGVSAHQISMLENHGRYFSTLAPRLARYYEQPSVEALVQAAEQLPDFFPTAAEEVEAAQTTHPAHKPSLQQWTARTAGNERSGFTRQS